MKFPRAFTLITLAFGSILSVSAEVSGEGYSVSPANFNLAVGEEGSFDVSFDASDVDNINGDYPGVLEIRTNDPNQRFTTVALDAEITGGYDLAEVGVSGAVCLRYRPSTGEIAFSVESGISYRFQKTKIRTNSWLLPSQHGALHYSQR